MGRPSTILYSPPSQVTGSRTSRPWGCRSRPWKGCPW
jgi:hypothetical protein